MEKNGNSEIYNVVFSGETKDGLTIDAVKNNIATLFKRNDNAFLEWLFTGKKIILKKNIDLETANKFSEHFNKTGALSTIEKESAINSETEKATDNTKLCPSCGKDIKVVAKVCSYCNHTLDKEANDKDLNDGKDILRKRLKSLFQFLYAVNDLKFRPERNIADQSHILKLSDLPEHPSIQLIRPCITESEQSSIVFQLRVGRAKTTPCPMPPAELMEWLISGWDNPAQPAKHIESQNRLNSNDEPVTVFFPDDPHRLQAWQQWNKVRSGWVVPEMVAREALTYFEQVYALHSFIEKESERYELMIGDGLLDWKVRSNVEKTEVRIHHPILLKRVELTFDPKKPEFSIVDTDRDPELYTSCLVDIYGINASGINRRQKELSDAPYHPMGLAETDAFLKAFIQTISPTQGAFFDKPNIDETKDYPRIWRAPVIFVRKRSTGVTNAISSILDDIEKRTVFPPAFCQVAGVPSSGVSDESLSSDGSPSKNVTAPPINDEDILLAKEANAEQMQIIRRLSVAGSVLVQGPPGTGKTHTIGNIIGHLLSQGKRILVTSHTPKALRVLRSQIPTDLQPLCVSVLGIESDSRRQLEASITEINTRLGRDTLQTLDQLIEQRTQERRKLLEDNRLLTQKLRMALESEYITINLLGKSFTPADAARYVAKYEKQYSSLPGPITWGSSFPLTDEELTFLYATNEDFTVQEEQDSVRPLPSLELLSTVVQFGVLIKDISNLQAMDLDFKSDLWQKDHLVESESLSQLLDDITTEFSQHHRKQSWRPYAIVAGMQGGTHRDVWEVLCEKIKMACELYSKHVLNLHFKATLSDKINILKQCEIISEILNHLDNEGKLGTMQLMVRGDWRKFINTSSVASGKPSRREHFSALHLLASLIKTREEIGQIWEQLIASRGGSVFSDLGSTPEQAARPLVDEIKRCLDWYKSVWLPLTDRAKQIGLYIDKIFSSIPREPSLTADYDLVEKASVEILPDIIVAQIRRSRLKECEERLNQLEQMLYKYGNDETNQGCICRLLTAIRSRDVVCYEQALDYTRRLHNIQPISNKRKALIESIAKSAPSWASAIANRVSPHNTKSIPNSPAQAWLWRQLSEELIRRNELDAHTLQRKIDQNKLTLRDVTIDLIAIKAWAKQISRVQSNQLIRQALVGWHDTQKKLKSTQKADIRWKLLDESRKLMKLSSSAVPVWIMPLAAVSENFDPASNHFDVVIIDEASQADLNALIAMYQADKVVIVGDHEQVTPDAVGQNLSLIHTLIDTYLKDIPNSRLFDNRFSIYDLARQSFGETICLVEHFRCVPEIIAFSNRLSYDGRIRPLRESTSTHITPACIAYPVNGVAQGQVNLKEAETITALIKAMCKHPAYANATIGVISMVGESQAYVIDKKLRDTLDPLDYDKRRILCGNSANFQGDERDIMLLSVIDSGKDFGAGPLNKRGEGAFESFKKRYNVASSRAKDQQWVVHSLDPQNDLKTDDLRRELILHAMDPSVTIRMFDQEEKRAESEFEREVIRILANKGYRLRTQWKVGYYRIDIVVQGNDNKRLAVECDGDRWHPIEKLTEDMERQAILERLGWTFARIRGSAFYRQPEEALHPVFDQLAAMGIQPYFGEEPASVTAGALVRELEDIIAADSPTNETQTDPNGELLFQNNNSKNKDAEIYFNSGLAYVGKRDYDKAVDAFTRAIEITPQYADAYYHRGMAYYDHKGYRVKAIDDCKKAAQFGYKPAQEFLRTKHITWQ
ncbi:MAG: AAA family ATPase [Nitrospirae bacterium]|nr:AAA family ATPase [Nitrospirota bacterium]